MRKKDKGYDVFEFDRDNFKQKSSEQRYTELQQEIKNTLKTIKCNDKIPGSSKEEKNKNILMHYKYKAEAFKVTSDSLSMYIAIMVSFLATVTGIYNLLVPYAINMMNAEEVNPVVYWVTIVLIGFIVIGAIAIIYIYTIKQNNNIMEKRKEEYMYYKYYYTELKKLIKEEM